MKFKKGSIYRLKMAVSWEEEASDLKYLESQKDKDFQMPTKELYNYLYNYLIRMEKEMESRIIDGTEYVDVILHENTFLTKIDNKSFDIIDGSKRFVITGTDIEVALIENFHTFNDMLEEVNEPLEDAILKTLP